MVIASRHSMRNPGSPARNLLGLLIGSKYTLIGLNALLIVFLLSRSGNYDLHEYSLSSPNDVGDVNGDINSNSDSDSNSNINKNINTAACPDPPPLTAASTASTTSIVEHNDPNLHETATVMAMATGYNLKDYWRFVGSLRKTGYLGNIILVVAPDIPYDEEFYLKKKDVIVRKARYTNCTHVTASTKDKKFADLDGEQVELATCVYPYPKLKHRWARFPLLRDLLLECGGHDHPETKCGGPVLITDMRDTFFQRNPFGPEAPKVYGLQVFEEHYTIRTTHWLVDWPVGDCKDVHYDEPMLCSGTTIGTRQAMLDYLGIFHGEMNVWMESPKCCCFDTNGDDQSMHNYLYYSGMLAKVSGGVQAVKNRNGIVHTAGAMGSLIFNTNRDQKKKLLVALNDPAHPPDDANNAPFDISREELDNGETKNWLGLHYGMTDREGYFVDYDGSRSFVVHQYDRFGGGFDTWLDENKELYFP